MTKTDLQSDLLADLQGAANARPLPSAPAPTAPPLAAPHTERLRPPTPSLDVRVTPLRWVRPGLVAPAAGLGLGLRLGPVQVSLSLGG
ncbi:MAG: hypothetical protein JWP11_2126 [Frankiales bacterium]|nr:hypothetical protein [Frankiales bacterium]